MLSFWKKAKVTVKFCSYDTLKPEQNGQHFKMLSFEKDIWILIEISFNFALKGSIDI